jgi:hypothetical protein
MARLSLQTTFIYSIFLAFFIPFISAARVVSYKTFRGPYQETRGSTIRRRSTTNEVLTNNITLGSYYATVQAGTPAQSITLVLGTGSSDVWMLSTEISGCSVASSTCLTPCK